MSKPRHLALKLAGLFLCLLTAWLFSAYLLIPAFWRIHWSKHPAVTNGPRLTRTVSGNAGDPINLSFVGSQNDLVAAMLVADWYPADPITLKSSFRIAESTILHRPYDDAPVSNLLLFGRKEDLAFEKPMGNDARRRHHVRFWLVPSTTDSAKHYWLGAITFDRSVGFSHTTGQITHHIDKDIDKERDKLLKDLEATGLLAEVTWLENFHEQLQGRNGGGDPYHTDGHLAVCLIRLALANEE